MTKILQAGAISAVFDGADLRYVRVGGAEILRRVYFAIRDRNWRTLPIAVSNVDIRETPSGWTIGYDAVSRADGIEFAWRASIEGRQDNWIRWHARGEALTSFLKNRIGSCVLHPVQALAGQLCEVEHVDGTSARLTIPREISPRQPFVEMRSLRHSAGPGLTAELRFSGDSFEIEDQRNWSDASFKIYSTALRLPFPAPIERGDCVEQSVELRVFSDDTVRIAIDNDAAPLPEIRLPGSLPLEIAVSGAWDLRGGDVRRVLLYDYSLARHARQQFPAAEIALGTPENFAELNRNRPDPALLDAVCFSLHPQAHASDNATLVENLSAQADIVHSARRIAGGKRVVVSPVKLGTESDPREGSWFGAAWTLGSLKYLAEAGADSVTYAEFARAFLNAIDLSAQVLPSRSTDPLSVESLVLRSKGRTTAYLSNFTSAPRRVDLPVRSITLPPQGWSAFDL